MNPRIMRRHLPTYWYGTGMPTAIRVAIVLLAQVLLPSVSYGQDADWALTEADLARLSQGAVLVDADLASGDPTRSVRAAVQVRAPAAEIFRILTDCGEALLFVPHLRSCAVLETAPDDSWQVVEQHIDYGWFMPHADYVFRVDYERFHRIRFSNVRGDFRENRGSWEFQPTPDGGATVVTYRVHLVPRFFVPGWMMRATLRRDLPQLLKGLRDRAETGLAQPGPEAGRPAP
jgi:uncharacterized membrane protein